MLGSVLCLVFFFQAEDGIRYPLVTGVQTCALPILLPPAVVSRCYRSFPDTVEAGRRIHRTGRRLLLPRRVALENGPGGGGASLLREAAEIGRASCRERARGSGGGETVENDN